MATARSSGARALPWYQAVRPGVLYVVGMIPSVWTFYLGVIDQLGADPMKALENELGIWALRFLIAGLAITPLRQLTGVNLLRYRRAIGLLAFVYVCLHLLTYVALDRGFDLAAIWADILKRPFITVGMGAFLILIPLAITSNNAVIRRIGGSVWTKIHRWVYLAAAAAAIHFVMVVKSWPAEPMIYAGIVLLLLGYRLLVYLRRPPARNRPPAGRRAPAAGQIGALSG